MATAVTTDLLRDLAGFQAGSGCAISIYLGFDPSEAPTPPEVETKFSAVLTRVQREAEANAGSHDCKVAVRDDLERIRAWWNDEFERDGARGVAIFASGADGLFRTVALGEAPQDSVHVNHELVLAPLAAQIGRSEGALVAVVSRERGSVFRLTAGRLVEVVDESDEIPGQHDQGGWSQARYQRHIEKLVKEHLKSVGEEVDRRARGRDLTIVGVGPEVLRGDFVAQLSKEARDALIGWVSAEAHAGPAELIGLVAPLLAEASARRDQEALERWQEERGRGGRAAGGWKQTLEAASDGRVDSLLVEAGAPRQAWRCPECGRASADGGKCPLDGARLDERADGADLAIHQTLLHGGTLVRLGPGALNGADGIGAILRY